MFQAFELSVQSPEAEGLLVGHLLDYLDSRYPKNKIIDCMDVAISALELGYSAVQKFIDYFDYYVNHYPILGSSLEERKRLLHNSKI